MNQHWNPTLYDNTHDFVAKFGEGIFSWLQPQKGEKILDLGCGTGDLTPKIQAAEAIPIGVDSSLEMIQVAQSKFPEISFQQADARDLPFSTSFDAIFSNAVLHWVPEKEKAIASMYKSLKKGGRIVLEFGGKDNIQQMWNALKTELQKRGYTENTNIAFWYFPSIGAYTTLLERQGFRVVRAEHFDRPTPLKGPTGMKDWFLMFAGNFFPNIPVAEKEAILEAVQTNLKATHFIDGIWIADYKRIRVMAIKEGSLTNPVK